MKSVNAVKGGTRIVDRNNVYEDVIDMYRCGDIVGECPPYISNFLVKKDLTMVVCREICFPHFGSRLILSFLKVLHS